jgi:hypothetical protein
MIVIIVSGMFLGAKIGNIFETVAVFGTKSKIIGRKFG